MPFRVFAAGEVLTAANVNDYLAEQAIATFAGTAARASAITSPNEGQFAYLSDSDSLTFYNGSAWVNAGSAIAGTALSSGTATSGQVLTANGSGAVTFSTPSSGLTLINTTSFSAVSSQRVNPFSATYDNYLITLVGTESTTTPLKLRLASGASVISTSTYKRMGVFGNTSGTTGGYYGSTSETSVIIADNTVYGVNINFFRPFLAATTIIHYDTFQDAADPRRIAGAGYNTNATSYDGFELSPDAGTITGTLRVYGYNI